MSELTGMEAQTVHRMLGMSWNDVTHQVTFQKTEKEPLEADAVIVDEMSMVDLALFSALLRPCGPAPGWCWWGMRTSCPPWGRETCSPT